MKVFVGYDGRLRARIGYENLGSECLGRWYGGTGAIRVSQVHDNWFWAYRLDAAAYRGTTGLPVSEFENVQGFIPSARISRTSDRHIDFNISDDDLKMLRAMAKPLKTRIVLLGDDVVAMFGDFDLRIANLRRLVLFGWGGNRFNGFRHGSEADDYHFAALEDRDMQVINTSLKTARLRRDCHQTFVEVDEGDLTTMLAAAQECEIEQHIR